FVVLVLTPPLLSPLCSSTRHRWWVDALRGAHEDRGTPAGAEPIDRLLARRGHDPHGARSLAHVRRHLRRSAHRRAGALLHPLGDSLLRAGVRAARWHGCISARTATRLARSSRALSAHARSLARAP